MHLITLWLAGFGISPDVLKDERLAKEIENKDGHAAYERLRAVLLRNVSLGDWYSIESPEAHLEFASMVMGNPVLFNV